ncbi:MAG: hypothetical protein IBX50_11625, partial [Marinospirillum sp.]|uniref:hypothetical protein n=1 Tax=Marinospirillum sp. TaxID=2183934 RepID=UPI0019FDA2C0
LGIYLALRSPLLETHIWPRLQPLIAEQTGFNVQLQRLRVDLLRSIQLEGISVSQQNTDCSDFNLTLAQVQLDFKLLPLLQKHLHINQLLVKDLEMNGCLMLDLDQQATTDPADSPPTDLQQPLAQLTQLLEDPPLSLDIHNLQLDNILIDLEIRERQQQLLAHWTGEVNLSAESYWNDNGIKAQITSKVDSAQPLQLQLVQQDQLQLAALIQLQLGIDLVLQRDNHHWQLDLQPLQLDLDLQQVQLDLQQPGQSLQLHWPDYQLRLLGGMHTRLPATDATSWPLQLHWQIHSQLPTAGLVFNADDLQLDTQLQHQLNTTLSGEINLLDLLLDQLLLDVALLQRLDEVQLQLADEQYQIGQTELQLNALSQPLSKEGTLDADLQLTVKQLQSQLSDQPLDIKQQLQLQLQQDLSSAQLLAQLQLNQLDLLDLKLQLENLPQQLSLMPQLQLNLPTKLAGIFPAAEPLLQLGDLKLDLEGQTRVQHQQNLIEALASNELVAQLSNQYQLQISQLPGTAVDQGLVLQHPLDINLQLHSPYPAIQPDIKLSVQSGGVQYPPLLQPLPFNLQLATLLNGALTQLTTDLQLALNNQPLIDWQLTLDDQPQKLSLDSRLNLNLNPELKDYLAELAPLDPLGRLQLNKHLELTLLHPATSVQTLDFTQQPDIQAEWILNTTGKGIPAFKVEDTDSVSINLDALIFPLHLSGQARLLDNGTNLALQNLWLKSGNGWLEQQLHGQLALDGQTAQISGNTRITPNKDLLDGLDIATSGHLQLPWRITLVDGEIFSLNATADFHDLSLQLYDFSVEGLNGQIKLDQELLLTPDGDIAFRYLLTPEAFQRVDFNRMEPYLGESRDISFKQLKIGELSIGPLHATLPIQQNLFRLQQFNLGLFDGDMTGQFYLDATPGAWRIGLLSRITRLDLRQLLPVTRVGGYAPVSARTAIEFDLNQRLLEGRIDITDINRTQLLQLLDIIDPDHLDPQMNTVRSALRLAHPRWISAEMEYGRMHLTFGLSLFAEPLRVRGLPLSQIIERFGEETLILTDQLPLEK